MLSATFTLPSLRLPRAARRHWLSGGVLAAVVAVNFIAAYSLTGVDSRAVAKVGKLPTIEKLTPPPAPEPLAFREVTPQDAVKLNAAVPISDLPNPAAKAFLLKADSMGDKLRSLECLTAAVYYEAAIEGTDGQRAVAQVVLNRVRHPAFPSSVCGVVFQGSERSTGCQFTFTCDGSLRRTPSAAGWRRAREVAEAALAGYVYKPVGYATHYHTNWVVPYWSASLTKLANVGTHIFYRWADGWGRPAAFTSRYTGAEPQLALMRSLTSDPSSLADAEATTMLAASEDPADRIAAASSGDSFHRAVLRRYEPVSREGVAGVLAKQTRNGDAIAASHRWALTGARPAEGETLARAEEVKPVPKACVDGAKKAETAESLAQALICS
jgi:spore germination cell wall hydrolase CwlJ-like protein